MSKLILPDTVEKKEEEALPFIMPELEVSEIEKLLKTKPEIARIFVEKAACGDVNWEGLSPAERGLLLHGIVETSFKSPNEVSAIQALWEADWIRRPPTPEEFINDPKYLGEEVSAGIYAPWRKDLIYVLDPKNEIHEWCFTGDTKISLYNEEPISIKQLVKEERTSFNVFSVNKDKKQVIGSGFNARLTRRNAELVEVLFVDGLIVRCTPDHPFLLSNGIYKQAQFLDCYDELMSCSSVNQVFMVTKCDRREDVYDISVEEYENFALENGIIVHNCLTGAIGVGKCLRNSFILNELGLLKIEEVYARRNDVKTCLAESGIRLITQFHDEGDTETIKIVTKRGYDLEARPNHRIRIFDGKDIIWKETKDLIIGDKTVIVKNQNIWGKNPENISIEQAELWGAITGDGCIQSDTICISFGNYPHDLAYQNYINSLYLQLGFNPKVHQKISNNRTSNVTNIHSREKIKEWAALGLKGHAWDKEVPISIRMGTKEIVAAFIRGLFDTDGTVYERGNAIEFTSCSKVLAEHIQYLFLNFGIISSRTFKKNKCRGAWTVRLIGRESKEIFSREIGFAHPKKTERLQKLLEKEKTTWRHNDNEIIPISPSLVEEIREKLRGKGLGLKQYRSFFVAAQGKQAFTRKALNNIVTHFGIDVLPTILRNIQEQDYIFEEITEIEKAFGHCYDLTVEGDPSYISNGFISHNTQVAVISQLYKLAVLTCLKNIPVYYGLSPSTLISFGLFTTSLEKAEDSISSVFRKMISESPYFRNIFPLRKSRTVKKILNSQTNEGQSMSDYEIVLPQNLQVLLGSKVNHALSLAVVSAILDEMNFRTKRTVKLTQDVDAAAKLYDQVRFRITSRFERLGHVPGLLCVISSRRTSADFIEAHIAQVDGGLSQKTGSWTAKNNPHIFISSYSQWDVKPEKFYKEGQPRNSFYVFLGTSEKSSRILSDEEISYYPKDSPNLIAVPSTLRLKFEGDINSALRELAGISSAPASLLFDDPQKINNIWDYTRKNPFIDEELYIGVKTKRSISSYLLRENLFKDVGFTLIPRYHPDMLRFIHIDLSKSGDATGIAMGGICAIKETIGSNLLGEQITASSIPELFIDFAISLKAPQGDQIDYEKIQQFISYLRLNGFHIHVVSFDTYNSVGPMQMLGKDGFSVQNVSVDRTDTAYVWFRDSVINNNIKCYKHALLEKQLSNLIHDYSTGRAKVDHPSMFPDGTRGDKELGDGIAGVVFNAFTFLTDIKKNPYTSNIGLVGNAFENIPNSKSSSIHEAFVVSSNEKEMLFNKIEEENPFKLY